MEFFTKMIEHALANNEFELYYQPQIDSRTDEIVGLEALIRWNHPVFGTIKPNRFIPMAEGSELIDRIGEWVIDNACMLNAYLQRLGGLKVPISINVSSHQIECTDIEKTIALSLEKSGLAPEYLDLEITESAEIENFDYAAGVLKRLKEKGIKITIDDFGTAYSSFNYIRQLPVSAVKIDKCFIRGIGQSEKDEAIISSIILMLKNLGMEIVAEGVETAEQINYLNKQGCNIIQGYYYYRPMPACEAEKFFMTKKRMIG